MRGLIDRLLDEAPKVSDADAPAIECAVMLGSGAVIQGALSRTQEGMLRMMSRQGDELVEQFFDYHNVAVVAVRRAVTRTGPMGLVG
jgi:hypothetical protein